MAGPRACVALGVVLMAVAGACDLQGSDEEQRALGPPRVVRTWIPGASSTDDFTRLNAVVSDGRRVIVGGNFDFLTPATGRFALLSARDARPAPTIATVAGPGSVDAIVSDGSGGWFLGGTFTFVAGDRCPGLARVRADHSLDRRFCLRPDGGVRVLARRGATLYLGGDFTRIAGKKRVRLASVDAGTAALRAWNPAVTGKPLVDIDEYVAASVDTIVASSSAIYVGGAFQRVGGAARTNLAALHPDTGRVLPWRVDVAGTNEGDPALTYLFDRVTGLALSGATLYAVGEFERVAGQPRSGVAALDASTARLTRWNPSRLGNPYAIAATFAAVYVATPRGVFARDRRTGGPIWLARPRSYGGFLAGTLAVAGPTLYLGGDVASVPGEPNVASIDVRSGEVTDWRPPPLDGFVSALAAADAQVAVGGEFNAVGEAARHRDLVALDAETGRPLPLKLDLEGDGAEVRALALSRSTLYVAGYFDGIAGSKLHSGLAAIDLDTGDPTSWVPVVENGPQRLAESGGAIYLSPEQDNYDTFGELPLSAIHAETAKPLPWRTAVENRGDSVKALVAHGPRVYLAGDFRWVDVFERRLLAAVDAETGELVHDWDPRPNGDVLTLAASDGTLFVGGKFTRIAGARRHGAAAFDADTGKLLPWAPRLERGDLGYRPEAHAFAASESAVFVAGDFSAVRGLPREGLAAVDPETARPLPWRVDLDALVGHGAFHLAVADSTLYFAGEFESVDGMPQKDLAAVRLR